MTLRLLHVSDLEAAFDAPERLGRLAGLVRQRRTDSTLVVGTGDSLGPSVVGLYAEGHQTLPFYDHVRPAVEVVGNHDFDHGPDALREVVAASPMPWLAANLYEDGERFGADAGVEPWTVAEAGDERIGLVGVTTPDLPDICAPADHLEVRDPVAAVADAVDELSARDVDRVVACSHAGEVDDEIAAETDVDAVLGGHRHDERIDYVDGTVLVRPGAAGRALVEVHLDEPAAFRLPVADASVVDDLVAAVEEVETDAGLRTVVDTLEAPVPVTDDASKQGESRVGNFVADAIRWATSADVGVLPAAGIRTDVELAGEVTVADVAGLSPFDVELRTVEVDGSRLRDLVGNLALTHHPDLPPEYFGHVSGMSVRWNVETDEVAVLTVGGEPVDGDATYEVGISAYFVETDHAIDAVGPEHVRESHGAEHEALVAYAREHGVDATIEGRIERT